MPGRYSHTSATVQVNIHFQDGLLESLDTFCRRTGKNRSCAVREAVTAYLMRQALTDCKEA